jgi:hypothetical protein
MTRTTRGGGRDARSEAGAAVEAATRLRRGRIAVAAGLAAGVLLAPRLFLAARAYPRVPVLERWPLLPAPLDMLVVGALVAAVVGVALAPRPRWWAAAATGLALVLGADDQSRWQPWFYQYAVMLATLALARDAEQTVRAWRVVLVGLYLWSGIQKLNVTFVTLLFPWLVEPLARGVPGPLQGALARAGIAVPLTEIAVALGLLAPRLRNAAVVAAVVTHVVVLSLLGPLAHLTNAVVWPWNATLAVLVVVLFWRDGEALSRLLIPRRLGAHAVALALFGILPAFSFGGLWDDYLSGALYSGNVKAGALSLAEPVVGRLPDAARHHVTRNRAGASVLDVWEWSMGELGVPSYPEPRVFRGVARAVCRLAVDPADVVLVTFGRPDAVTGQRDVTRTNCAELDRPSTSTRSGARP